MRLMNPVNTLTPSFLKIHFNAALSEISKYTNWPFPFLFSNSISALISHLSHAIWGRFNAVINTFLSNVATTARYF